MGVSEMKDHRPSFALRGVAVLACVLVCLAGCGGSSETAEGAEDSTGAEEVDPHVAVSDLGRRLMDIETFRRSAGRIASAVEATELNADRHDEAFTSALRTTVVTAERAARSAEQGGDAELAHDLVEAAEIATSFLGESDASYGGHPPIHAVLAAATELLERIEHALESAARRGTEADAHGLPCVAARFASLAHFEVELVAIRTRWEAARDQDMVARRRWMYGRENAQAALTTLFGALEDLRQRPTNRSALRAVTAALRPEGDALESMGEFLPPGPVQAFEAARAAYEEGDADETTQATLITTTEALMEATEAEYHESPEVIGLESSVDALADLVHALEQDGRFAAAHAAILPRDDEALNRAVDRHRGDLERVTALCLEQQ